MTQESEDAIKGPLVFQCLSCMTIVGDSWSYDHSNGEMLTITLKAVSNVKINREKSTTSTSGPDMGSTYFQMSCEKCDAQLGRSYITTPRALDNLRDIFTFDASAVKSYELGQPVLGEKPTPEAPEEPEKSVEEKADVVSERLVKMQQVLLSFNERLQALESAMSEKENVESAKGALAVKKRKAVA